MGRRKPTQWGAYNLTKLLRQIFDGAIVGEDGDPDTFKGPTRGAVVNALSILYRLRGMGEAALGTGGQS